MKIVVLDGYTLNPGDLSWDPLKKLGEVALYDRTPNELISERIADSDIIITNKTPITKEILDKHKDIKYIGVLATGYNVVDVKAAKENDVVVTNVPSYSTDSVAQMVFALILSMCHHVESHSQAVRSGDWTNSVDFCFWNNPLIELKNKTLGIIGAGSIGIATAKIAHAFGMNVVAYSRTIKPELENDWFEFCSFDQLLNESDFISLHCPLFDETKGIINKESISKMKEGVKIINTSRGPLIVEQDLADALDSGKVSGAAMDVLSEEPPKADNPLLSAKNCIITPHIAWASKEARVRLMDIAVANVKAFIDGEVVNKVS